MGRRRPFGRSRVRTREAAAPDRGRSRRTAWKNRRAAVVLMAVTLALYGRSLGFGFVHADDVDLIAGNAAFLGDPANLPQVFTRSYFQTAAVATDVESYYRPIVIATFMADTIAGGGAAGVFHATNVMLHALSVVLALALVRRLGLGPAPACAAALVFAVHPLNAHAVYWIPGRNELLLAVFALAAWLAWLRAVTTGRHRWLAAHGAAWLLALLSKETASVLPLVWALHAWQARRWRDVARLPLLAAWLVVGLVWLGLRTHALGWGASGDALGAFVSAVWSNLPGMLATIGKAMLPVRLNVTPGVGWQDIAIGAAALALLGAVFARCLPVRTQAFIWGWCLLAFLPALGVRGLPAYEHRAYLPLLALVCGVALALDRRVRDLSVAPALQAAESAILRGEPAAQAIPGRRGAPGEQRPLRRAFETWIGARAAGIGLVALVCAALGAVTVARGPVYADPFRFWEDGAKDPQFGPMARVNLGQLFESIDRLEEAERQYRLALALDPLVPKAHNNLGVVLMALGRRAEAAAMFERERALHPGNADAHYNLGLARAEEGKLDEAIALWERAIAANRAYLPAYEELARAYRAKGMPERATAFDEQAAIWRQKIGGR
jgi:tetratricopeptide (TPR) repeat protein